MSIILAPQSRVLVGERMHHARKAIGFSMQKMGENAGVSRQAVNSWEKGNSVPDWFSLENLKKNIYLSPEWVMMGKGDIFLRKDILEITDLMQSEHFDTDSAIDYLKYLASKN